MGLLLIDASTRPTLVPHCVQGSPPKQGYSGDHDYKHLVDAEWLHDHLDDPNLVILDATTFLGAPKADGSLEEISGEDTYREAHIPGAIFADLINDFSDPNSPLPFTALPSEDFATAIGNLSVSNTSHVVVYDQGQMMWATRLWWNLRLEGYIHPKPPRPPHRC